MYGTEVSPSLISSVTDAVATRSRPGRPARWMPIYPIVYLDCIHVKVREGAVRVKAVYLAIGITMTGEKEVLGLWLAQTEGAKFWLQVVTELRNRGVQDIFIACVDGLKGFPDAIEAVFPKAVVQLCIVHMVRHSLNYVSWKRRKEGGGRPAPHLHGRHRRGGRAAARASSRPSGMPSTCPSASPGAGTGAG
jgi:putative transposase